MVRAEPAGAGFQGVPVLTMKGAFPSLPVRMLTAKDDAGSRTARGLFSLLLMLALAARRDPTIR